MYWDLKEYASSNFLKVCCNMGLEIISMSFLYSFTLEPTHLSCIVDQSFAYAWFSYIMHGSFGNCWLAELCRPTKCWYILLHSIKSVLSTLILFEKSVWLPAESGAIAMQMTLWWTVQTSLGIISSTSQLSLQSLSSLLPSAVIPGRNTCKHSLSETNQHASQTQP